MHHHPKAFLGQVNIQGLRGFISFGVIHCNLDMAENERVTVVISSLNRSHILQGVPVPIVINGGDMGPL